MPAGACSTPATLVWVPSASLRSCRAARRARQRGSALTPSGLSTRTPKCSSGDHQLLVFVREKVDGDLGDGDLDRSRSDRGRPRRSGSPSYLVPDKARRARRSATLKWSSSARTFRRRSDISDTLRLLWRVMTTAVASVKARFKEATSRSSVRCTASLLPWPLRAERNAAPAVAIWTRGLSSGPRADPFEKFSSFVPLGRRLGFDFVDEAGARAPLCRKSVASGGTGLGQVGNRAGGEPPAGPLSPPGQGWPAANRPDPQSSILDPWASSSRGRAASGDIELEPRPHGQLSETFLM